MQYAPTPASLHSRIHDKSRRLPNSTFPPRIHPFQSLSRLLPNLQRNLPYVLFEIIIPNSMQLLGSQDIPVPFAPAFHRKISYDSREALLIYINTSRIRRLHLPLLNPLPPPPHPLPPLPPPMPKPPPPPPPIPFLLPPHRLHRLRHHLLGRTPRRCRLREHLCGNQREGGEGGEGV